MPNIFKAFATVIAWFLFIWGWLTLIISNVEAIRSGAVFGAEAPPTQFYMANALAIITLILAVVAMKLRKGLE